jgi:hypothetical protein
VCRGTIRALNSVGIAGATGDGKAQ